MRYILGYLLFGILVNAFKPSVSLCNHKLTDLNGVIETPGYPNLYPHNLNCSWQIIVPVGRKIKLITKTFHLESSYNCESDALYIYDGASEQARLYSRPFCDVYGPKEITSSGNSLFLRFITDRQDSRKGFKIQYKSSKVCDFMFNESQGSFTSPLYPNNYKENSNCSYRITTESTKVIVIRFNDFILENKVNGECLDSVKIYDIIGNIPRLSKVLCGNRIPRQYQSVTNQVLVKFHSDNLISNIGFNATFHSINHFCGQNQFKCDHGRCISVDALCDQVYDCYDKTDESRCSCTRFKCKNLRCISNSFVCDGQNQCGDWSDELQCHAKTSSPISEKTAKISTTSITSTAVQVKKQLPKCKYAEFRCENQKCVSASQRCNGFDDCDDNSDENDCVGQCKNSNGGCEHVCSYDRNAGVTCSCYQGFLLDSNEKSCIDINECSSRPCEEICNNNLGSFECRCRQGYRLAEDMRSCVDFDECVQNTFCEQDCINKIGSYECVCFQGYTFSQKENICVDVNECDTDNGGCSERCENLIGGYKCACHKNGYMLIADDLPCEDMNECEQGLCKQKCVNTDGSYRCECKEGFRLDFDLHTCLDIDECQFGVAGCWGNCINNIGSYICQCGLGFKEVSNRTKCEDINECLQDNGGCSNICVNTVGSFECKCHNGYIARDPRSFTCVDQNECETMSPCDGKCINTPGSFVCQCEPGYELVNNTKCIDVDECLQETNGCEFECVNTPGSFICTCADGFRLAEDKKSCVKTVNSTGCRRLAIDATKISDTKWTAATSEWPWKVKMSLDFGFIRIPRYNCIGLLLDANFVLTTADCLRHGPNISIETDRLILTIGGYGDSDVINIYAEKLMFHPQYDIGLVKLKNQVKLSSSLQKLCLPEHNHVVDSSPGSKLVAVNLPSNRRNAVTVHTFVEIVAPSNCFWDWKNIFDDQHSICASFNVEELSLPMSGSPLVGVLRGASMKKRKQKWILTGFLVRGSAFPNYKQSFGVMKSRHVGYLKASQFTSWLKEQMTDEVS